MKPREIEYPPTPGNRCYCCVINNDGIFCTDTLSGRVVRHYGGSELNQMPLGSSIRHCLKGDPDQFDGQESVSNNHDDGGKEDPEDPGELNLYLKKSDRLKRYIKVNKKYFALSPDSTTILKPNEPNGVASEIVVFDLLSDQSLFPWIESVRMISRISTENGNGVDIALTLAPNITDLLTTNQVYIQVKSDPSAIPKFIKKYERKNHLKEGVGRNHLLKHNFILLNGGAGRVRDIGVIAPFIAQLHQLICLNNSPEAGNQFLQLLGDELQNMLRQPSIIEILERDYSCILDLSHLHHAVF